jgi:hypothetical protein
MGTWWILWMVFMLFLWVAPVGYGWGYRGWGPPYPRYLQRRRSDALASRGMAGPFKHESWGWGGDALWLMFFVAMVWVISGMWWPFWIHR